MNEVLWQPGTQAINRSNMSRFVRMVANEHDPSVTDYAALHRFSIDQPAKFWQAVWEFCGIRASRTWDDVVIDRDKMPGATWFPGSRLNFAQNLLRRRDDQIALNFIGESGKTLQLSYAQLFLAVEKFADALREFGIEPNDRVAAYMPNLPQTVIAMLACTAVGAVWTSCSPDFGVNGVVDRFGQTRPRILIAADGYHYNGKVFDCREKIRAIQAGISSIEKTIIVPYLNASPALDGMQDTVGLKAFMASGSGQSLSFEQLPFDHPVYIMYSSGTTGVPKCIVHGAGGTLIQHLKELVLHTDLSKEDNIFYFTTCGWMMWNWLVSSLAVGATVTLYDGSPAFPRPDSLFDLVDSYDISVFGTSAKWLSALEKSGAKPIETHKLNRLRCILSTGSPLAPESFDFVYSQVKKDLCLSSISGGTDIISCFALGNPVLGVRRGELQCRGLGMDVVVIDDANQPVIGEQGELACLSPFPSMPIGFWNDPEGSRYHDAYFARLEGAWCHGDFAELKPHGGLVITGRSDATLNPGGVRIGTAEIYRQVEKLEQILESLAIGQPVDDDQRVVLFVRLRPGLELDKNLQQRIRETIRNNTTPRHVPAVIIQVADIPRTISGKVVELAVRNVVQGLAVTNIDALANPEALEYFRNLPELRV